MNSQRNTPTHVGKTPLPCKAYTASWKHPHARGEDPSCSNSITFVAETPPRTWGRRWICSRRETRGGNTPTHVGKTPASGEGLLRSEKHPHARGEDSPEIACVGVMAETPPRTWGRRVLADAGEDIAGNTPTHVGKTSTFRLLEKSARKHPHARGEDTWNLLAFFLLTFNKELGRHLNQKLKIFPFGRNTGLQAKKSNSSVDESLSPQCTWL